MPSLGIFVGGLILGILLSYIIQILDMAVQHLANKQAVAVSKMNKEIDKNSKEGEVPELMPAIGFHVQNEEEIYSDEEDE